MANVVLYPEPKPNSLIAADEIGKIGSRFWTEVKIQDLRPHLDRYQAGVDGVMIEFQYHRLTVADAREVAENLLAAAAIAESMLKESDDAQSA